ncbi:hypothetical protein P3S67_018433 [Capsicum chacoense]
MGGIFSKFIYNNLRSIREEVQRLDLLMNEGTELNDLEFAFSCENSTDRTGKRPAVEDFSIVSPSKILRKTGLSTDISASQPTKGRKTVHFDAKTVEVQEREKAPPSISRGYMSTDKTPTSISEHVDAGKTCS